ncbi:polysaccharide biosynthesis tyrosine autokinase [Actinomycetospora sp. OC33-EN08]|uniref:non-specific protein-tyrosine kinase n=1 Tax=Actinomycetospora aurantiaca TaxID=3129233 RepID=A0ABU8MHW5_9PSEU
MSNLTILGALRRYWMWVAVPVVLGALVSALATVTTVPQYTATAVLYVSAQNSNDTTTSAYQGSLLSEQKVDSYEELLRSRTVAEDVIRRTGVPYTSDELLGKLTVGSELRSVVLQASVRDEDPVLAANLANAYGDAFAALIANIERPATPGLPASVVVRTVDPAVVPAAPSAPDWVLNLIFGAGIGLLVGIGGVLFRQHTDTSVRSSQELSELLDLPTIGSIPFTPEIGTSAFETSPVRPRWLDSFQEARTNLQFMRPDHPPRVLLVTSSVPGEGKTTTVTNLAESMARAGLRVVVVDADLRKPALAKRLGLETGVGLTQVLTGLVSADEVLQRTHRENFWVMASGPLPPNPGELLESQKASALLEALSARFDRVLIDTAPLLAAPDALGLSVHCDGVLLVCRADSTGRAKITSSRDSLANVNSSVVGGVLTMVRKVDMPYYSSGYYGSERSEEHVPTRHGRSTGGPASAPEADSDMVAFGSGSSRPSPTPR